MMLLVVEYVSWIAFIGAGLIVAWLGADILRAKLGKRTKSAPEAAQESGRGLAGPAEPLKPQIVSEVSEPEAAVASEPEPTPEQPAIEPAEELVLPVTQAVTMADEVEESDNDEAPETAEVVAESAVELEPTEDSEEAEFVGADVVLVRRDPSVRVFDAVVAPSERKVHADRD